MNFIKTKAPRIDTRDVKAAAKRRMRENGNYKRISQMLGLMMLLINAPTLIMNYASMGVINIDELNANALAMLSFRMLIFEMLMALFVAPAFTLSKARFMLNAMRDKAGKPAEIFDGLKRDTYFVSVRAMLWTTIMMCVWLAIPAYMILNELAVFLSGGGVGALAFIYLLGALAAFISINRGLAYSLQFYMLAEHPGVGAIMSLRLSVAATRGRLRELFVLELRLLLYTLPEFLPNLASLLFFKDSIIFGVAMSLCSIALYALCYPVAEGALAEYFLRVESIAERRADAASKARDAAWSDGAQSKPDALPGDDTQSKPDALPGDDAQSKPDALPDDDAQSKPDALPDDGDKPKDQDETRH